MGWLEAVLIQAKILPFGILCVPPVRLLHCHRKKRVYFGTESFWGRFSSPYVCINLQRAMELHHGMLV